VVVGLRVRVGCLVLVGLGVRVGLKLGILVVDETGVVIVGAEVGFSLSIEVDGGISSSVGKADGVAVVGAREGAIVGG
jgi:hypothetical protein